MRVALTGAGGFVGRRVLPDLVAAGFDVLPLVRRSGDHAGEIVVGDLAEMSSQQELPSIDVCLHLAGRAHILKDAEGDPLAAYRRTNVEGTRRLLEAVIRSGVQRFVFVSSAKAAGERSPPGRPLQPDDEMHPEDAYGVSKAEAETLVRETCDAAGVSWTIIRPPLVYGPGVPANFGKLMRLSLSGLPLPLGATDNRRSMVFVGNLSDALQSALTARGAAGRVLYVSDGEDLSTADLVRRIARAGGRRAWLVPVPRPVVGLLAGLVGRRGEFNRLFGDLQVDSRPTREALEWAPPFTVDEALALTVAGETGSASRG